MFHRTDDNLPDTGWTANIFQLSKKTTNQASAISMASRHACCSCHFQSSFTKCNLTVKFASRLMYVKHKVVFSITWAQLPTPGLLPGSAEHPLKHSCTGLPTPVAYSCTAGQKFNLTIKAVLQGTRAPLPEQWCKSRLTDPLCWVKHRSVNRKGSISTGGAEKHTHKLCCLQKDCIGHIPFILPLEKQPSIPLVLGKTQTHTHLPCVRLPLGHTHTQKTNKDWDCLLCINWINQQKSLFSY